MNKAGDVFKMPGLFVIGMPKSGTSSLFYWLDDHPEFQGATPKETFFFMDKEHPLCGEHGLDLHTNGIEAYQQFFPEPDSGRIRFEGTTHYFYQHTARDFIASLSSKPLVVILLREPAVRILSSFRFTRDNLANCDKELTFDQYVGCLLDGTPELLDKYYHSEGSLAIAKKELSLSCYVEWLDWWQEAVGLENLEIILFEDLKKKPGVVMRRLARRLGVDDSFYMDYPFDAINKTTPIAYQRFHRWAKKMAGRLPKNNIRNFLKRFYLTFQARSVQQDDSFEEGLLKLRAFFLHDNRALEKKYRLNLSDWNLDDEDKCHG